jgi:hypothetical protein
VRSQPAYRRLETGNQLLTRFGELFCCEEAEAIELLKNRERKSEIRFSFKLFLIHSHFLPPVGPSGHTLL